MLRGLHRRKLSFKRRRRIRYPREPWVSQGLADAVDSLEQSYSPNRVNPSVYASLLRRCAREHAFSYGVRIHRHMDATKYLDDTSMANLLIRMYSRCGNLEWGSQVFETMDKRTVQSWNAFLGMLARNDGSGKMVYRNFRRMLLQRAVPDAVSFALAIRACGQLRDLSSGTEFHNLLIDRRVRQDHKLQSAIIYMYGKCGRLDTAIQVFGDVRFKETPVWNAVIAALWRWKQHDRALEFYWAMAVEGKRPDSTTYAAVLEICVAAGRLELGSRVVERIASEGLDRVCGSDLQLALVKIYAQCRRFDRVKAAAARMSGACWNYCFEVCARGGFSVDALELYTVMRARATSPDPESFVLVLGSCRHPEHLSQGKAIHARAVATTVKHSARLVAALVRMYSECGSLENARLLFKRSSSGKEILVWNAMLEAYVRHGEFGECLALFDAMKSASMDPNEQTLSSVFAACCDEKNFARGKELASSLAKTSAFTSNTLRDVLNMYALCGDWKNAKLAFDALAIKEGFVWATLASAYLAGGREDQLPELFQAMELEGLETLWPY
ncbi:pentatricopeptide repeat-containing protein At1g71460, chloroplastic [Selaginella moellendorffii]|uniref:pentatricopeptide repeat-containing protein At1g71460, chloroplastic n=1 Tax=Selaginella moellendorffii TaxID=88036 RepID=UPI000D1CDF62|nr:pentatricopeptide repeat-containing protein At1g71460, chloroplastic [Selaginella moellendorffii]|eukprot:XP_024532927.1 pentatricopeptide repeat-containing protein At1g71460, chloroplastic [Selaginella moellendorffii]